MENKSYQHFSDFSEDNPSGMDVPNNPCNFSSNPGFSESTATSLAAAAPPAPRTAGSMDTKIRPNPTLGRSAVSRPTSVANPAPGATDPGMDGSPLVRTSGFGG